MLAQSPLLLRRFALLLQLGFGEEFREGRVSIQGGTAGTWLRLATGPEAGPANCEMAGPAIFKHGELMWRDIVHQNEPPMAIRRGCG
jgi:hypothetical protein